MAKARKALLIFVLALCLLTFAACHDKTSEQEIISVELVEGSVKEIYDVDEEFGYGDAFLNVLYGNGDRVSVVVTSEMVKDFNTSTTGKKTFTVAYEGKSVEKEYEVIYSPFPAKKIETDARLTLAQSIYPTGVGRTVSINTASLQGVKAVSFTLKGNTDIVDDTFSSVETVSGLTVKKYYVGPKTMKLLIYTESGIVGEKEIVTVNFAGLRNVTVTLTDITLSDGKKDYYLPDVAGV